MKNLNTQNELFIICPFCQLEIFLRKKYGDDIFFMTAVAGVLNFNIDEIVEIKYFLKQENIKIIYLVNDVSCNFIEEAINNKKEFGLSCESDLRLQLENIKTEIKRVDSLEERKYLLAKNNLNKQLVYLNSNKILKDEMSNLNISINTLITNKQETKKLIIQMNKK